MNKTNSEISQDTKAQKCSMAALRPQGWVVRSRARTNILITWIFIRDILFHVNMLLQRERTTKKLFRVIMTCRMIFFLKESFHSTVLESEHTYILKD